MHFMTAVQRKIQKYGFTRKVAVLITRIERGVDSLDNLCGQANVSFRGQPLVGMSEYLTISQYLSEGKRNVVR